MGSSLSSHEKSVTSSPAKSKDLTVSGRGRKSLIKGSPHGLRSSVVSFPSEDLHHDISESIEVTHSVSLREDDCLVTEVFYELEDEETESSDSDDDEDEVEDWEQRFLILEDARKLKQVAEYFLHPEKPVVANTGARCFFGRVSAPDQVSWVEAEERSAILADAKQLKKVAMDFMHPEVSVVTSDTTACGRNYFTRASAPDQERAEERAAIMADLKALKQYAFDFMHPERPIVTTDPTARGRNYFDRASAPEQEDAEDGEVRAQVLADAAAFKQLALDFMHPELPVVVYATACGRNFFSRATADEQESLKYDEDRTQIMQDMKAFKKFAADFLHPEYSVSTTDSACVGRNYFSRPSAPEQESLEDVEERAAIMADIKALKQLAIDYMHPETSVKSTDPSACGRNYFTRHSAPEQESFAEAEDRAAVLADVKALKKLAVDFIHPEIGVVTSDGASCGRNYFTRPSAPEQEDTEAAEERSAIIADLKALKTLAVDYMHPEMPIVTNDPTVFGRNYFTRPSAPEQEDTEEAEERARIMQDLKAFKKLAVLYMHPEVPMVTTDSFSVGRNYFSRPSAPEQESLEDVEERAAIMADIKALKQLAIDYMHPEVGVVTCDPCACGRNYFDRATSALHYQNIHTFPPHDDEDSHHEHEHIDHFGMDEEMEMFADIRQVLATAPLLKRGTKAPVSDSEEGNLSRSPSSVFLSGLEGLEYEY